MKKLVCDRCGAELKDEDDMELAFAGQESWEISCSSRGLEARGIIPCEHFVRCGGEMQLVTERRVVRWWRWLKGISRR